jgi:hypothetical protein
MKAQNTIIQEDLDMISIPEKHYAEQTSIHNVSRFFQQYQLGKALKKTGAYKQKGIPVATIMKYLISLVYIGKTMFEDLRSSHPFANGFKKDAVYRLLNQLTINWTCFLLGIASNVVKDIDKLTSEQRRSVFIIDDTFYPALYAKQTELVSRIYDHAEKGKNKLKRGFRMLTLGWSDGVSFVPLAFRHLASADKNNRYCESKPNLDKRSRAFLIREEAVTKATEILLKQLKAAVSTGIAAKHVVFDSWFAYPLTITKIQKLGLHVTARVKNTTKILYLVNSEKKTAKQIFQENKKRPGKSRYLLSVPITLLATDDGQEVQLPAKLVYVRNRNKRNDWIALVSTDLSLSEHETIALYGKRWDIETFFKICKSYLKLTGEFRQLSYDAITAHTTIVMLRYMILTLEKRKEDDPRSLGELFFVSCDEVADLRFEEVLILLMSLLGEVLDDAGLPESKIEEITDKFIEGLPSHMRLCLKSTFGCAV